MDRYGFHELPNDGTRADPSVDNVNEGRRSYHRPHVLFVYDRLDENSDRAIMAPEVPSAEMPFPFKEEHALMLMEQVLCDQSPHLSLRFDFRIEYCMWELGEWDLRGIPDFACDKEKKEIAFDWRMLLTDALAYC